MQKKINFIDLGKQPITNNFLSLSNPKNEFFYDLKLIFHCETKLVSLAKFVSPKKMFNEKYAHQSFYFEASTQDTFFSLAIKKPSMPPISFK